MKSQFIKDIVKMRGEEGRQWLLSIPSLLKMYEQQWGITVLPPFRLTCNYVAPVILKDGSEAVIKIRFPKDREFPNEYESLRVFNGLGAVKLLEVDKEHATMLLEKVTPGTFLRTVTDDTKLVHIIAELLKTLDKPVSDPYPFLTLTDLGSWFGKFRKKNNGTGGPFPRDLFEEAEAIFAEYSQDAPEQYFLHGDIHKDNILLAERGWISIDPTGVIGEKEYELSLFLQNPYHDLPDDSDRKGIIRRRVSQFAEELGYDAEKIYRWTFARSMLTAVWILEDFKEVSEQSIQNAELLHQLV